MEREEAIEIIRKNMPSDKSLPVYEALHSLIPELTESEDERIRKEIVSIVQSYRDSCISEGSHKFDDCLAWLEKQKEILEKEYVFRPLTGTDITIAAEQAIRRANEGDRLVLAFNGWYVPVDKHATTKGLVDSYDTFIEKQKDLDKMIVVTPEVWDNAINEAYENGKKDNEKQKPELPLMDGDTDTYFDDLRMTTKPLTSRGWFDEGVKYAQRLQKEQKSIIQDVELNDAVYDYVRDHFIAGADFTPEYIKKLMENAFFAGVDYYLLKQESESYELDTNVEKVIEDVIRVYGKTQGEWVGDYDVDTLIVNLRRAFNKKEQKPVESISQLAVQGKGVYKICPRCKERMVRDDSKIYTSMLPQYGYKCPKCGEMEFDTVMYDNPEMEEQKPNSTEDMPYITDEHFYEREPADSFKYKLAEYMTRCCTKKEGPYGYEYGISAESILKMAEEELLKRGVVQKPAEWHPEDEQNLNVCLSYIKDEPLQSWLIDAIHVRYDKPAEWSEEDEKMLKRIEDILLIADDDLSDKLNGRVSPITDSAYSSMKLCIAKCLSWLKSLLLNLKKKNEDVAKLCSKEWSQEDEDRIRQIERIAQQAGCTQKLQEEIHDWLKSLRPQPKPEWSEEDEKTFWGLTAYIPNEELERLGITRDDILKKLQSLRLQPIQLKEAYKEGFQTARHATALAFMNYLDENRPKGKMCLSNSECEDIEKAFLVGDWEKIERYFHKCQWKPSEHQMNCLKAVKDYVGKGSGYWGEALGSLIEDLEKLM